jgi:hypothetical protein
MGNFMRFDLSILHPRIEPWQIYFAQSHALPTLLHGAHINCE